MDRFHLGAVTMATLAGGLAAGTTTTLTTANKVDYSIKGKAHTKAAASNEATPTEDAHTGATFKAVGVSKGSVFTICRNAGGDLKVVQGTIEDLDAEGNFITAPQFGPVPDTLCPYGYIVVKVDSSGSAWTFGASNLAGPPTGVTFAFVDCFTLPPRPQVK